MPDGANVRRVKPLPLPDIEPAQLGPRPDIRWVAPTALYVDEAYQRQLSKASMGLLKKASRGFAWAKMKVPNVVEVAGQLHMIDGQHTAIAAATAQVPEIPVLVVKDMSAADRANSFVGLNTERVNVTKFNIHKAQVAAGDPEALAVDEACRRSGARLRSAINATSAVAEGDTTAIGIIRQAIQRNGLDTVARGLTVLVGAKRGPIIAAEILAVCHVFKANPGVDDETLMRIIRADGDAGVISAHMQAKVTASPVWRCLVDRWKMKGMIGGRRIA